MLLHAIKFIISNIKLRAIRSGHAYLNEKRKERNKDCGELAEMISCKSKELLFANMTQ